MKFKASSVLAAVIAVLFVGTATAESKFYLGLAKSDWDLVTQTATTRSETGAEGNQIVAGLQAGENFSIELAYGQKDDAGANDSYYAVFLRPQTQLFSAFKATVILGMARGDYFDGSDDFAWGFGAEFTPSDAFSVNADWIHYSDDLNGSRVTGLTVGARFHFGGGDDD